MDTDLFETPELIPENIQAILDGVDYDNVNYTVCQQLENDLKKAGYSIEWGLDASPYNLHKL